MIMNKCSNRKLPPIIGSITLSFLLSISSLFFPASQRADFNDSAIYQYIGYLITKGKTPYIDAFDHKGIYFYFLNSLGYQMNSRWGMWVLIWILLFFIVLVIYRMAKRFLPVWASVAITLIISTSVGTSFWDGDTPDSFAVLFTFLAFEELTSYFTAKTLTRRNIFIAGCATAIAFWMKPNMILGSLLFCLCLIIYFLLQKQYTLIGRCFCYFSIGFALCTIPALAWLASRHALRAMLEDYFLFNFEYMSFSATNESRLYAFSNFISLPACYICLFGILGVLISYLLKKNRPFNRTDILMLTTGIISFAVSFIHAVSTGNSYPQYPLLFLPSVTVILIWLLRYFRSTCSRKIYVWLLAAITGIAVVFNGYKEYENCKYFWNPVPQEADVISYLQDNSESDDTIAIVSPYYAGYYLASGRDSATKYVYVQANHFVNLEKNPSEEEKFWKIYAEELKDSKPRIILLDTSFRNQKIIKKIKELLSEPLRSYKSAGESYLFQFYVLPDSEAETIRQFHSDDQINNSIDLTLPKQIGEDYRNGKLEKEDIEQYFDAQWEKQRENLK